MTFERGSEGVRNKSGKVGSGMTEAPLTQECGRDKNQNHYCFLKGKGTQTHICQKWRAYGGRERKAKQFYILRKHPSLKLWKIRLCASGNPVNIETEVVYREAVFNYSYWETRFPWQGGGRGARVYFVELKSHDLTLKYTEAKAWILPSNYPRSKTWPATHRDLPAPKGSDTSPPSPGHTPESGDWRHTWPTAGREAPWSSRTLTVQWRLGSLLVHLGTWLLLGCESLASTWEAPSPPTEETAHSVTSSVSSLSCPLRKATRWGGAFFLVEGTVTQ